jgi:PDZ domain-containing protein
MTMRKMTLRIAGKLLLLPLVAVPSWVAAQSAGSTSQSPAAKCGAAPVGFHGISGVVCANCVFSYPGEGKPSLFATEPRISNIAQNSPAAAALRVGDVLVSVDDRLITTIAGGMRLANMKPGETVVVEVRRRGEVIRHKLANLPAICPSDPRVLGSRARSGGMIAPRSAGMRPSPARADFAAADLDRPNTPALLPRASFGFSISCRECDTDPRDDGTMTWRFREPPEIYQVDAQSQAFRAGIRRGDVITRIDGTDILSAEGGRKFGQVRPGQAVRFTTRRGSSIRSYELRAEARRYIESEAQTGPVRAVQTDSSLRQLRQMIQAMRRQEMEDRQQIEQIRKRQGQEIEQLLVRLARQQQQLTQQFESMHAELSRADRSAPSPGSVRTEARLLPNLLRDRNNTFRYAGKLGDTDIEVRGPAGVVVKETRDSIIITTIDSTIRLKKSDRR